MNKSISQADVLAQFQHALQRIVGAIEGNIIADGKLHRFRTETDNQGQRSGWYVLHLDGVPAGSFGNWKTGEQGTWCAVDRARLTTADREAMARRIRQQQTLVRQQREANHRATAMKAQTWWSWSRAASSGHAYLQAKQVKPYNLRQHDDVLLVPMTDDGQILVNLQRIYPDGKKRFLSGGRVKGCYSPIQGNDRAPLYICEGWATGATIHALNGVSVACAMNAGNLLSVAQLLRARHPGRHLVIAGDNDRHTKGNPGKTAAINAARAIGAEWMVPDFPDHLPGTDYNDRYRLELEGKL